MPAAGFRCGDFRVGEPLNPYLIAEIGVNHGGDMRLALRLIEEASRGGAHAAKFQSYKADLIACRHSPAYWDISKEPTTSQHELFQKYDAFEPADYRALAEHCREHGIDFMSTPFDVGAVDWLDPLVPMFKIASADITNVPLIRRCAATGKPLLISTGAALMPEIEFAVETAAAAGAANIALLHCILRYPTEPENARLAMIPELARRFPDRVVGYSDHVVPDEELSALEAATMLGACVLEKHFTYDKSLPGNDHYHAMDERDLRRFVAKLERYRRMYASAGEGRPLEQDARLHARRSIVAARDIRAGTRLTAADLVAKRPAHGISPTHWDEVIGMVAKRDISEDTILVWEMLRDAATADSAAPAGR
jgi:sialic acid synthase SpsE